MKDVRDTYPADEAFEGKHQLDQNSEHVDWAFDEAPVSEEESSLLRDDIGLKGSLAAGIVHMIPDASVGSFVDSVKASLLGVGSATVAAGGIAAAATKIATSTFVVVAAAVLLTATAVTGGVVVATQAGSSSEIVETHYVEGESFTIEYAVGNIQIIFTDRAGNDGDVNVIGAHLVEEDPIAAIIIWQLVKIDASGGSAESTVLRVGNGTHPESELFESLEPGYYRIIFTLEDRFGAQAEISRSFSITNIEYNQN